MKKLITLVAALVPLFSQASGMYDPSYSQCKKLTDGESMPIMAGEFLCFDTGIQDVKLISVKTSGTATATANDEAFQKIYYSGSIDVNGLGFHVSVDDESLIHNSNGTIIISDAPVLTKSDAKKLSGTLSRVKRGRGDPGSDRMERGRSYGRSWGGGRVWGGSVAKAYINDQARKNYAEYRKRRDRSGDAAARARSSSRSDMNSPGDHGPNDKIGGR